LRGGKATAFEGGIRVVSFASGGAIPPSQRGTRRDGYIHTADWLATLAAVAKVRRGPAWCRCPPNTLLMSLRVVPATPLHSTLPSGTRRSLDQARSVPLAT